uniref:L2919 protein n=1 Tax=Saccharomyces cerevisiae TaxID=4932 RepID=E9PA86_YEASX|nr:L2919 [Saccharomyces cerevisiae]
MPKKFIKNLECINNNKLSLQQQSSGTSQQSTSSWQSLSSSTSVRGDRVSWSSRGGVLWSFSRGNWSSSRSTVLWGFSGQWAPGGVLSDNVIDGDGSGGNQSWGDSFRTDVVFTRSDGDQSGRFLADSSSGNVSSGRSDSGDSGDRSDSRKLHY